MKGNQSVQRGELIRCDFGNYEESPGGSTKGERPALVIQNDVGNKYGNHVIVAVISRKQKSHIPVLVNFSDNETPLASSGTINCAHLYTVGKDEIISKFGTIGAGLMAKVDEALRVSLALD